MAKRFGRPAPSFEDERSGSSQVVREIRLLREGSGIEGVYDSISAIDAMHTASAETSRKRAVYDGVLHWTLMIAFWSFVVYLAIQFLRNLHS
jgi:hypothetical protein